MNIVQLYEWTPKQLLSPTPTPNQPRRAQKIKTNANVGIQGIRENESCSTT